MQQLGATFAELTIPPPTPTHPYPPLPLPVDDAYIFVSHILPQPTGTISKLVGFNIGIQIYMTCTPLATMELAYGIDELFDWPRQKRILEECLENVKHTLENIPAELQLVAGNEPGRFFHEHPAGASAIHNPPLRDEKPPMYYPHAQPRGFGQIFSPKATPARSPADLHADPTRQLQYEMQKANIYASQLGTRSYIVEKYWNLLDTHDARGARAGSPGRDGGGPMIGPAGMFVQPMEGAPLARAAAPDDAVQALMSAERETIVQDLLRVLGSISQVNMEPNGGSFINKIRQIASTLLDTPRNHKGPLALRAEEYLEQFLDVLMRFEGTPRGEGAGGVGLGVGVGPVGADAGSLTELEEEVELRNWSDLREYQTRFAKSGGFQGPI